MWKWLVIIWFWFLVAACMVDITVIQVLARLGHRWGLVWLIVLAFLLKAQYLVREVYFPRK